MIMLQSNLLLKLDHRTMGTGFKHPGNCEDRNADNIDLPRIGWLSVYFWLTITQQLWEMGKRTSFSEAFWVLAGHLSCSSGGCAWRCVSFSEYVLSQGCVMLPQLSS
jgi:hypothetical protein